MFGIYLHYHSFILTVLFSAVLALSVVCFKLRGFPQFRLIAVYFGALLAVELFAQDMEQHSALYTLLSEKFIAPALPTAICYCVMVAVISELMKLCFGWKSRTLTVGGVIFFSIWFVNLLLLKAVTLSIMWLYILPYQIFTLFVSLYGICTAKKLDSPNPAIVNMFRLTAVFSVLIIIEDSLVAWWPSMVTLRSNIVTTRNIAENILQIIYAITVIKLSVRALLPPSQPREGSSDTASPSDGAVNAYADKTGLSTRERDVLSLLLIEKTNQEICELLSISLGTAKAHTHNIYQKSGCENRSELRESFDRFVADKSDTKM